jgi:hypothetical protein
LKIPITKKSAGGEAQGSSNPSTARKPKKQTKTLQQLQSMKLLKS